MALTLKNYSRELTKDELAFAAKCTVRECDETEAGVFMAYVDDGTESFDAALTLSAAGEVMAGTCDCANGSVFCRHKAALLIHLSGRHQAAPRQKTRKKQRPADTLLEQVDAAALREWVKILLEKNKEIELAFMNTFSVKKSYYPPAEVIQLIHDAVKIAECHKKKVDVSKVKKLVELWSEVLQPVIRHYRENVTDPDAFLSFNTLVERCLAVEAGMNSGSVRITRFVEDVLHQSEAAVNNLEQEDSWMLAAGYFGRYLTSDYGWIRMEYAVHLKNILIGTSNLSNRRRLLDAMMRHYRELSSENRSGWTPYTRLVFGMINSFNLFPDYYLLFKPLHFENDYNVHLIRLLIEHEHLEMAKEYCHAQIATNYRQEFNVPYLQLLKLIYTLQKDEVNLAITMQQDFAASYDFDDYLFIIRNLPPEEQVKWRADMLARARAERGSYHSGALTFLFRLLAHEKQYQKMIEYFDGYTPYAVIVEYFDEIASAHKEALMEAILRKPDSAWHLYPNKIPEDKSCYPALFQLVEKHYGLEHLSALIGKVEKGKHYHYSPNRFVLYMKARLAELT